MNRSKAMYACIAFCALAVALTALPVLALDKIELQIAASDQAKLDQDPFHASKVPGTVILNDTGRWVYPTTLTGVAYRGSYRLLDLIAAGSQRLWKIKLDGAKPYRRMREWNFDLDDPQWSLRYKLALDLFSAAGVPTIPATMVNFYVNGNTQGFYYQYPDVDNKEFLESAYGTNEGDLYKVGMDIPNEPCYFGETTWLEPADIHYGDKYRKMTNNNTVPVDMTSIQDFIYQLNKVPDSQFTDSIYRHFDIKNYIKCLVVTNFIGHWDGFPQRGKNYWLYLDPRYKLWHFHPWDLHRTFDAQLSELNRMGAECDIITITYPQAARDCETTNERPLYHRLMKISKFKSAYIQEYRRAVGAGGYLTPEAINARLDAIRQTIPGYTSMTTGAITDFIARRTSSVTQQLNAFPVDPTIYFPKPLPGLKITEVMYHPLGSGTVGDSLFEFIELKNIGATDIDLTGSHIGGGVAYSFPAGKILRAGQFCVITSNAAFFTQRYLKSPDGQFSRKLNNDGETIIIQDSVGNFITTVTYGTQTPWPVGADGAGFSLVTVANPAEEQNDAAKWKQSRFVGGSPWSDDESYNSIEPFSPATRLPKRTKLSVVQSRNLCILSFSIPAGRALTVRLYDVHGRTVRTVFNGNFGRGTYSASLNSNEFTPGLYLCRMSVSGGERFSETILVLR